MKFEEIPRQPIANLPTQIERMSRISEKFPDTEIYVKRDDQTGFVAGGNKARKLEFLLAEALDKEADCVITGGGPQSNHARMTVAGARKLGLDPVLVLEGERPSSIDGNLLLDHILDAELNFVGKTKYEDFGPLMDKVADRLKNEGRKPYVIPLGGSNKIGALGYLNALKEIFDKDEFDCIIHASSSGGTQAGLLAGAKLFSKDVEIIGINAGFYGNENYFKRKIEKISNDLLSYLDSKERIDESEIIIKNEYIGEGYGHIYPELITTIKEVAKTEGLVLDTVYSGKAMVGMLASASKGEFTGKKVLFIHTGGLPSIFHDKIHFI